MKLTSSSGCILFFGFISYFFVIEVNAAVPVSLGKVGDKEFFVLREPMESHYARWNCTAAGLRLVEIYTEEENTFLKSSPGLINGTYYLTGGYAKTSMDAYYWETSGKRINPDIFRAGYNPNSYRILFRAGQNFGDWFSPKLREFKYTPAICQSNTPAISTRSNNIPSHSKIIPRVVSLQSKLSQTNDLPFVGEAGKKKYYVENNMTLNYEDAWTYCIKFGFTLSSIETKEEMDLLEGSQLLNKDRRYWTSAREHLTLPYFRWDQTQKRVDGRLGNFNPIADSTAFTLYGRPRNWLWHIHDHAYILSRQYGLNYLACSKFVLQACRTHRKIELTSICPAL